jgi:Ca2+-binding EF-hand superfamily protein
LVFFVPTASPDNTEEYERDFWQLNAHQLYFDYDDVKELLKAMGQKLIDDKVNKFLKDMDELENPSRRKY